MHEVKVRGATRSIYDSNRVYKGDFSESQKLLLRLNCDQIQAFTIVRSSATGGMAFDLSAGVIAGVACVAFSIVLALLALGMWRKYFNESYYYLDESPATPAPSIVPEWDLESTAGPDGQTTAIPAHLYIQRVSGLHADGDLGFSKEFESIQALSAQEDISAKIGQRSDNQKKNRYPNVIPCKALKMSRTSTRYNSICFLFSVDHTRVQLRSLPGQKRGEYLNANYIDGFQKGRAYIATQGPLPATFDSFWRMIWEQKVKVIVMITNLVEMGKVRKGDFAKKYFLFRNFLNIFENLPSQQSME